MRNRRAKRIISCLLALVLIFGNVQGLSVLAAENGITNTVEESVIPKEEEHLSNEETEESLQQETEETLEPETGDENKTEVVEEEIQKPQKEQVKKEQQDKKQTEEKTEILEEKKEVPVTICLLYTSYKRNTLNFIILFVPLLKMNFLRSKIYEHIVSRFRYWRNEICGRTWK